MMISRRNFLAVAGGRCRCSDRLRRFFRFFYQHRFFRCCFYCFLCC